MQRRMVAWAGSAVLAVGALAPAAAYARGPNPIGPGATVPGTNKKITAAAAEACWVWLGSVTATGQHGSSDPTATVPPTVPDKGATDGVYQPGQIRLSARQTVEPNIAGIDRYGYVVIGDGLYASSYALDGTGEIDPSLPQQLRRIGGGWSKFTFLETAEYESPSGQKPMVYHSNAYALRNDGVLFRWNTGGGWRATGSYAGFSAVKTMTLIAKTRTYDTFLANTRGGALYTIRIPLTSPMKPIVKQVRTRTWQGFETLSAMGCGQYGTLLLGIDKDTKKGYLYAVGHANGLSTVIQSRGEVPGPFDDPVYFRWVPIPIYDVANGD
ncbi:hypothetical protein AB0E63_11650 [Kribbella sp. NPDC026596]|uniref:hypothetical protein n=1 Tax=Kribbella sp. NPDC026596 TaxID=3155122 RepID=UPI0033F732D0